MKSNKLVVKEFRSFVDALRPMIEQKGIKTSKLAEKLQLTDRGDL
jgi:hypothetical protein